MSLGISLLSADKHIDDKTVNATIKTITFSDTLIVDLFEECFRVDVVLIQSIFGNIQSKIYLSILVWLIKL